MPKINILRHLLMTATLLIASLSAHAALIEGPGSVKYRLISPGQVVVDKATATALQNISGSIVIPRVIEEDMSTVNPQQGPFTVVGIDANAFRNTPIESVDIQAEITALSSGAFIGCGKLSSVTLPASLSDIGASAFENCTSLQEIELPDGLSTLGNYTFRGCTSLRNLTLPEGVAVVPEGLCDGAAGLLSVQAPAITTIKQFAFQNCPSLQTIELPATLKTIGRNAFTKSTGLQKISFPSGVKLENNAFSEAGIREIDWGPGPIEFGSSPFFKVSVLESVTFPSWMETVAANLFNEAKDLKTITFEEGVKCIGNYTFSKCPKLTTINLPESLDVIQAGAFHSCSSLTGVRFPERMQRIEKEAFYNCTSLGAITLPKGATICNTAFNNGLTAINWPQVNTDEDKPVLETYCFGIQNGITEMTIPGWLTTTPDDMMRGWGGINSLIIEEGVQTLGDKFLNTANESVTIKSISFPASLRKIGNHAFNYVKSLTEVNFQKGLEEIGDNAFSNCSGLTNITLPESVKRIGNEAFSSDKGLTAIHLPSGLESIGNACFMSCNNLVTVNLPDHLKEIPQQCFQACTKLQDFHFPTSLEIIGNEAFQSAEFLGVIDLSSVKRIGNNAFRLSRAEKIIFPIEAAEVGTYAFSRIRMTENDIVIPAWMTTVPDGLFENCGTLTHVSFAEGSAVETIGSRAFLSCTNLHPINLPATITRIGEYAFSNSGSNYTKEEDYWHLTFNRACEVANNAFEGTKIATLDIQTCDVEFGNGVFSNVNTITSISFPDCMTEIPKDFCQGWQNLETVHWPASLEIIGESAFSNCTKLASVDFSGMESLKKIGVRAFNNSGIKSIEWGSHSIEVGAYAFSNSALESLTIPAWMTTIPAQCFSSCSNLSAIDYEERSEELVFGDYCLNNCRSLVSFKMPPSKSRFMSYCVANCPNLKNIEWTDFEIELGPCTFYTCANLEEVNLPSTVTTVPNRCFYNCNKLRSLRMSDELISIGNEAFWGCAFTELPEENWSKKLTELGSGCFGLNRKLTKVEFPETVSVIPENCFSACSSLTDVALPEGVIEIGSTAFSNCSSLPKIAIPNSVERIKDSAFQNDSQLATVDFGTGLRRIDVAAFQSTALTNVDIRVDHTDNLAIGNQVFRGCKSLTDFHLSCSSFSVGDNCFRDCTALQSFRVEDAAVCEGLGDNSFNGCTGLTTIDMAEDIDVKKIGIGTFKSCSSLSGRIDFLKNTQIGEDAFYGCTSLKGLDLPYIGLRMVNTQKEGYFYDCSSLQYLNYRYTGKEFCLSPKDIHNAPLRGVSSAINKDIIINPDNLAANQWWGDRIRKQYVYYNDNKDKRTAIAKYTPDSNYKVLATPETSILYVERGEKWKFEEAGYNQIFTIIERKSPTANLSGDIFSEYDRELNVNHYKGIISWDMQLSDLDWSKPTQVTIKRDAGTDREAVVIEMEVSVPKLVDVTGYANVDKAYEVTMTITGGNGKPSDETLAKDLLFVGSYDYLHPDGYYKLESAMQKTKILFDARTHKRIDGFDKYTNRPWVIFVDPFDSPALDSPDVPLSYTYTVGITPYTYKEYVNNEPFELDETTGLYYHEEEFTTQEFLSEPYVVHPAITDPSMVFPGVYTTEQIMADTGRSLKPSVEPTNGQGLAAEYNINPEVMEHKGLDTTRSQIQEYIVNGVEVYSITDAGAAKLTTKALTVSDRNPKGTVNLASYVRELHPGDRFQLITTTTFRGTFGSPVMTVPGVPQLVSSIVGMYTGGCDLTDGEVRHNPPVARTTVASAFSVTDMGYDEDALTHFDNLYVGIWRNLDQSTATEARSRILYAGENDTEDHTLVHHTDGMHQDGVSCSTCSGYQALNMRPDISNMFMTTDVYHMPDNIDPDKDAFSGHYDTRIYVRVPDKMLRSKDKWMIADAPAYFQSDEYYTGVGNVGTDSNSIVRRYTLSGIEVTDPQPGEIYIVVKDGKAAKEVYRH